MNTLIFSSYRYVPMLLIAILLFSSCENDSSDAVRPLTTSKNNQLSPDFNKLKKVIDLKTTAQVDSFMRVLRSKSRASSARVLPPSDGVRTFELGGTLAELVIEAVREESAYGGPWINADWGGSGGGGSGGSGEGGGVRGEPTGETKVRLNGKFINLGPSAINFNLYIGLTALNNRIISIETLSLTPYGYSLGDVNVQISGVSFTSANNISFHATITTNVNHEYVIQLGHSYAVMEVDFKYTSYNSQTKATVVSYQGFK